MSPAVTAARVAAESAAWVWYPDDADVVRNDRLVLVRWPDYFGAPPNLLRVSGSAPVDGVLDEALAQVRAWGRDELVVRVGLDAPAGLEDALAARGARVHETLDVLALDLGDGVPGGPGLDVPSDVEVRWQADEATTRDALRVAAEAFEEGAVPSDERVGELAVQAAADHEAGRASTAVAYLDGRPVGSGGLTLAGAGGHDVARLWGGGVVPEARGRGVYRAVLAARLDLARTRGASMALVKGRVETSGPILRRAGFAVFGRERSHVLPA
ncbi:GNAT family N-acetyltransferase [Nocardioides dongxiaopingii]|uniref:GNAT family N-acetyltransferase n=1 Tax=Nocardioides sp. S-1144 TaxID=2582905 RepID=UPI00110E5E00|nr:GNAT family N-acetyltransferase [Nocardioides sp. S-1144]QCW51302.1 GNAT family N-acetyltransferase [Nocardioides sp. S-1144]